MTCEAGEQGQGQAPVSLAGWMELTPCVLSCDRELRCLATKMLRFRHFQQEQNDGKVNRN